MKTRRKRKRKRERDSRLSLSFYISRFVHSTSPSSILSIRPSTWKGFRCVSSGLLLFPIIIFAIVRCWFPAVLLLIIYHSDLPFGRVRIILYISRSPFEIFFSERSALVRFSFGSCHFVFV